MPDKTEKPAVGWSVLLVPSADAELLLETLRLDSESRVFDRALRVKIERALDQVTEFEVTHAKAMAVQELLLPSPSRT
jgi:hypothetical protein